MSKPTTNELEIEQRHPESYETLAAVVRAGARKMLIAALEAEVEAYIQAHNGERDAKGHALVVRNGYGQERTLHCGAGTLKVQAPRVYDQRRDKQFTSKILPPYLWRSPRLETAVPVLYLRGLSTGDFQPALSALLGEEAVAGFSASTVTRLLTIWQEEYRGWRKRSLAHKQYVYLWADGLYFKVRLGDDARIACLVLIGVTPEGRKEVVAIEDGYRESTAAWATVLRDLRRRGLPAPKLAVADGALGFWAALRQVYPEAAEQRCWVHKIWNVLDKLPQRLQARAKAQLHEIMRAPSHQDALEEIDCFVAEFEAKYPKAVATLTKDQDTLLTFFDYPAAHWLHLRTTNAVESPFATVKQRMKQTRGAGSRDAGLAMAFKLLFRPRSTTFANISNIEYKQMLLARYACQVGKGQRQLTAVSTPQLYETPYVSPQLECFVLDDDQWLKVMRRPPYATRKSPAEPIARQLLLWRSEIILFLWLLGS